MEKITVELGNGDCPCCHKNVGSKKMVFVESDAMCLDYAICIKCYDKIHSKVMKVRDIKHHCTQCERKKENPWCSSCKEKDCEVDFDSECKFPKEAIEKYEEQKRNKK